MFHYPYRQAGPDRVPAAFVLLRVADHDSDVWHPDIPALADTGADQTMLPRRVVDALGLTEFDTLKVAGFDNTVHERPLYAVQLIVRDLPPVRVPVIGGGEDEYAVLGRDVLNFFRVVFDGPNQRLEISG